MGLDDLDLFEHYNQQPDELRAVCKKYQYLLEIGEIEPYQVCKEFLRAANSIGYTFEVGLDHSPYDLKKSCRNLTEKKIGT